MVRRRRAALAHRQPPGRTGEEGRRLSVAAAYRRRAEPREAASLRTPEPALERAELPADAVEVGRVIGPWGVRGALRIKPHSAAPEALFSSKRWYLQRNPAGPTWLLAISIAKTHGEHLIATAHDLADRDAAELLAGARIFVSRASFPTPEADEYYWVDLIGLAVVNREARALGTVTDLFETGPSCVLRVRDESVVPASEHLIPFVAAYVDEVDLEGRRIRVDWLPDD